MQKLWIVTELFYPDETSTSYVLSKIANKLVDKYDVNVITSLAQYQINKSNLYCDFELDKRIKLHIINAKTNSKKKLLIRFINFLKLTFKLGKALNSRLLLSDKVLIVTNPLTLLLYVGLLRKKQKFDYTILVHDVFPENTVPTGIIRSRKSIIYRFLKIFFDWSYAQADKIIVLGVDMYEIVLRKLPLKSQTTNIIHIIENWADLKNISNFTSESINLRHDKEIITIQYAGNIGRAQGLNDFIDIIRSIENENLCFDFYGDGVCKTDLEQKVLKHNLTNIVKFHGSFSRYEQNEILNSTDFSIIILAKGMAGLGVPSKFYNILASGKPIIYIGDQNSEVARVINLYKVGFCFAHDDISKIRDFFNKLSINELSYYEKLGLKSRFIAEKYYAEELILNKYLNII